MSLLFSLQADSKRHIAMAEKATLQEVFLSLMIKKLYILRANVHYHLSLCVSMRVSESSLMISSFFCPCYYQDLLETRATRAPIKTSRELRDKNSSPANLTFL